MYYINLTKEDIKAIEFVAGRYGWSDYLFGILESDETERYSPGGYPIRAGKYELTESQAWEFLDEVKSDTDDFRTSFPLLSDDSNLADEILRLWNEVV